MKKPYHHIPIKEAAESLKGRLKAIGFDEIFIEDDDPGFKNFFAKSDRLFEDSFFTIQILLYELYNDDGSGAGMEFHALFFTRKGRKIQRSLSRNGFERLRTFLDIQLFEPAGLKVVEYDARDPSDRNYTRAKNAKNLFPDQILGVEIHVGGWLCKENRT
jgi:hypothetical protein